MTRQRPESHDIDPTSSQDQAELFSRARADRSALEELVARYQPLADGLARRYHGYGEPLDDLVQVASIGLLNAIDRFDPARGVGFAAFATPTIVGELKRHFRDRGWAVRMPRRLQENTLKFRRALSDLTQSLGRSPTVAELSTDTGLDPDEVLEAGDALLAYSTTSLDTPVGSDVTLADTLSMPQTELEGAEGWADVGPHLAKLPERERRIIVLRFFRGLTQTEIAEAVGVSQMHVSRLLARALRKLRDTLAPGEDV